MKTIYRMLRQNFMPLIISAVLFAGGPGPVPSLSAAEDSGHNVEMESAAANAAIADWGAVMNGEKRRDKLSVRPFLIGETVTCTITVADINGLGVRNADVKVIATRLGSGRALEKYFARPGRRGTIGLQCLSSSSSNRQ